MKWCDFYNAFWDWSDSTRRTRISSLEDIGPGDEIVEAVVEMEDPKGKAQLIRKAMKLGARFTRDDFMNLDGELPDELYEQLGWYTGFGHKDPHYVRNQVKTALDNFATDRQITQLERDVDVLRKYINKPAKGCLQNTVEFGFWCLFFMIVLIVGIMLLIASGN